MMVYIDGARVCEDGPRAMCRSHMGSRRVLKPRKHMNGRGLTDENILCAVDELDWRICRGIGILGPCLDLPVLREVAGIEV